MKYITVVKDDEKSRGLENKIKSLINGDYCNKNPDIAIAIGGDGTLLQASHLYPNAIIFGIHTGHLGFYRNYMEKDLDLLVADINNKTYISLHSPNGPHLQERPHFFEVEELEDRLVLV